MGTNTRQLVICHIANMCDYIWLHVWITHMLFANHLAGLDAHKMYIVTACIVWQK